MLFINIAEVEGTLLVNKEKQFYKKRMYRSTTENSIKKKNTMPWTDKIKIIIHEYKLNYGIINS